MNEGLDNVMGKLLAKITINQVLVLYVKNKR